MKRSIRVLVLSPFLLGLFATSAFAHFCTVADKPPGAGQKVVVNFTESVEAGNSVEVTGVRKAGKSDNYVASGAFAEVIFNGVSFGDVFIRGPVAHEEPFVDGSIIKGTGMMNDHSTLNGSTEHGVMFGHPE